MLRIFTILFILISASPVLAKNHVILIGGGGEPEGTSTIFDHQLPNLGKYIRTSRNQELNISFNGGHSETERLLQENFPAARPSNFTESNYEALITRYEREMRNGTIKSGEKVLLMINTHGAESQYGQKTHSVSTSVGVAQNLKDLSGSQTVSLDRLQNLARLAEEKGVKLGIIDLSCHSGASLKLGNSRTCVISASGENSFSYAGNTNITFASQFTGKMAPGKNLEEVFLEARSASSDFGFPMISSAEGIRVQNRLYGVLRSYINNYSLESYDKFSPDITDSVEGAACIMEREEVQELIELSRNLERVRSHLDLEGFRKALQAYSDYRRAIQRDLVLAGGTIMNEMTPVCESPGRCTNTPINVLLTVQYSDVIEYQHKFRAAPTEHNREILDSMIRLNAAKQELFRVHPGMRRYENFFKNYPNIIQRTNELAERVAMESRKLYSAMYHPNTHHTTNACREFTL